MREEFCAGHRDANPNNDRPCPMPRQPLKMTGDPRALVGNAVGYRCRECRVVFCAACAWSHFGLGGPRGTSEVTRLIMEGLIAGGAFDALVRERASAIAGASP